MLNRHLTLIRIIVGLITIVILTAISLQIKLRFNNYFPLALTNSDVLLLVSSSFLIFFLGILIEWPRLDHLQYTRIKFNNTIVLVIILMVYSFIPTHYWIKWLSLVFDYMGKWAIAFFANYLIFFLSSVQVQTIILLLTGILFIRSIENK